MQYVCLSYIARFASEAIERNSPSASVANYNRINEWPLQFLRTGYYFRSHGYPAGRTTDGHWWSLTSDSDIYGDHMATGTGYVIAQRYYSRGGGFALRCNTDNVAPKANQLANFPLNFLRTGHYNYSDGKVYYRTTRGYWWSATRSSATNAYNLDTSTTAVGPQSSSGRGYGFAVRCVAR